VINAVFIFLKHIINHHRLSAFSERVHEGIIGAKVRAHFINAAFVIRTQKDAGTVRRCECRANALARREVIGVVIVFGEKRFAVQVAKFGAGVDIFLNHFGLLDIDPNAVLTAIRFANVKIGNTTTIGLHELRVKS